MVGRDIGERPARKAPAERVVLEARSLELRPDAEPVSFQLHAGEVLGVAGLVGSSRSRLASVLGGIRPCAFGRVAQERERGPGPPAARRRPRRHRRHPRGPQARRPDPRPDGAGERRPRLARGDLPCRDRRRSRGTAARPGDGRALRRPAAEDRSARAKPQRRQPAEGRAGEVARAQAGARGRRARRADTRGGRRRQVRDLPSHRPARRSRGGRPPHLLRAARGDRDERPHPGHELGRDCRRAAASRVRRGADPAPRRARQGPRRDRLSRRSRPRSRRLREAATR